MQLARRPQPCVTFAGRQAAAPLGNSPLLPSRSRLPLGIVAKAKKTKDAKQDFSGSAPPVEAPSVQPERPSQQAEQPVQPLPQVSPSLLNGAAAATASVSGPQADLTQTAKVLWKRLLKDLSSLPRAIALMAATFGFSALGTFIPQNKSFQYYIENYPETGDKVLGFLTYNWILTLELDHIYTSWYFYFTLAWLAASLMACTSTRQWPAVKVAQRWRFQSSPVSVAKQGLEGQQGVAEVLPSARVSDLGAILSSKGYKVFVKDKSLYAFKGLAGKLGPIGVHAALLLTLLGTSISGFGGYKGTVMIPEGGEVVVGDILQPVSPVALTPEAASKVLYVNNFRIDYRPDGQVAQFYSDLSLLDPSQPPTDRQLSSTNIVTQQDNTGNTNALSATAGPSEGARTLGQELLRKTISVNDPFRYGGVTMYQTDWSLSGVRLRVLSEAPPSAASTSGNTQDTDNNDDSLLPSRGPSASDLPGSTLDLPMASLEGRPGISGRLWGSYLPVASPEEMQQTGGRAPRGVSILARDPQSVVFYDSKGQFVGVRRPGSGKPIEVEGVWLVTERVTGATGLELKSDPGVPLVYAGFGGLMVTVLVSYVSHSQVWAVQEGNAVYVGGRSNRAKIAFQQEMDAVLDAVPELPQQPQQA